MPKALKSISLTKIDGERAEAETVVDVMVSDFSPSNQEKTNWCWAAVGSGLYNFWGGPNAPVSQSWFASKFGGTTLNEPRDPVKIITALEKEVEKVPDHKRLTGPALNNLDSLKKKIAMAIRANKPVPLAIAWRGDVEIGHLICVLGLSSLDGESAMIIYDPSEADECSKNLRSVPFHSKYSNSYQNKTDKKGRPIGKYQEYKGYVTDAFVP